MLINLHSHLEGRVRTSTAVEIAAASGVPEPAGGWENAIQLEEPADLTVYLRKVAATYQFFRRWEHLERIACEAVEDSAADGQDYLELRFGPATHVGPHLSMNDVIAAVCSGVSEGTRRTGMPTGVVVAALRHSPAELNQVVAGAAVKAAGSGVVGFDLAGDELLYPDLEPHADSFAIARSAGLGLTCHVAEAGPAQAVEDAVRMFGVTRVGHAAHLAADSAAMGWVAERGIAVEICPTSNWYTGAIETVRRHPAQKFRTAGVRMVLGDDNPMQTRSPLSHERDVLKDTLGFSEHELAELDATSIAAAFTDESTRAMLHLRNQSSS